MTPKAVILAAAALPVCACQPGRAYVETRNELQRYYMVQTRGDISFLPGGLSAEDFAGDPPEHYARLQKEAVTCRADIVVSAKGNVIEICTACTNKDQYAWRVSDSFVRRVKFKPGDDRRTGTMVIAYAPTRPDASLILPQVPAPAAGCPPQSVTA
jgi:hypothetical protein